MPVGPGFVVFDAKPKTLFAPAVSAIGLNRRCEEMAFDIFDREAGASRRDARR